MTKRRLHISVGTFLLMLMSIGLTISTLHSHHNLELHNSADFADTGHCLTSDTTLCPICAHLVQTDVPTQDGVITVFQDVEVLQFPTLNDESSSPYLLNSGRSPPFMG